jgi:hypothetical protein
MTIEAMKQALEALELHAKQYPHMQKGYTVDAIASLRQAIAEAEKQKPLCTAAMFDEWFLAKSGLDPKTPIYTHPQPKQEMYGYVSQHTTKGMYEWQFNKELSGVYKDTAISILPVYTHPQPKREPVAWEQLYPDIGKPQLEYLPASPFDISGKPQPKREPLTDAEHEALMRGRSTLDYGRAVEAAHGIKE